MKPSGVTEASPAGAVSLISEAIESLALVLDLDEEQKLFHAWRVAVLAHAFSEGASPESRTQIFLGGLLHDIGAIGLDDHIVHLLSREEQSQDVRNHPARSAAIIGVIPGLDEAARAVADHHEHADGSGYPRSVRGGEISDSSYFLAIADQLELALRAAPAIRALDAAKALIRERNGRAWPQAIGDAAVASLEADGNLLIDAYEPVLLDLRVAATRAELAPLTVIAETDALSRLLLTFGRVIDAKHHYTVGHSLRVAFIAYEIASVYPVGVTPLDAAWAGFLHDVGKVGIPRRLLDKEGFLSATERVRLQRHSSDTYEIVSRIGALRHLAHAAAAHHEQWDGGGYPRRLAGEEIPPLARVLAYADVYDAIRSDRSYRHELSHEEAIGLIRRGVGTHFDPALEHTAVAVMAHCRSEAELNARLHGFIERLVGNTYGLEEMLVSG